MPGDKNVIHLQYIVSPYSTNELSPLKTLFILLLATQTSILVTRTTEGLSEATQAKHKLSENDSHWK